MDKNISSENLKYSSMTKHGLVRDYDNLGEEIINGSKVEFWWGKKTSNIEKLLIVTGPSFNPPPESLWGDATRLIELLVMQFRIKPDSDWERKISNLNPDENLVFLETIADRNDDIDKPANLAIRSLEMLKDQGYTPIIDIDNMTQLEVHSEFRPSAISMITAGMKGLKFPENQAEKIDDELSRIKSLSGIKDANQ